MIDKTIAQHLQERREVHRKFRTGLIVRIQKRKGDMHDPGKQLRHYVAKQYVEVAGTNSGWQNKSNSVRGNRRRTARV